MVQVVVAILELLFVLSRACIIRGCEEKVCTPDHVLGCVFTYVKKVLVQAVVGIFVVLSVFAKIVEVMMGCEEKVCTADQVFAFPFT